MIRIFFVITAVSCMALSCNDDHTSADSVQKEQDEIQRLYHEAKAEGNEIIIWSGGDAPGQMDWIKNEWEKDFPDISIKIRVDLSKVLDAEIDQQLADNNLTPDITHLQTIHDFHRWKARGLLENFKPEGWDHIPAGLKDPEGAFTPVYMVTFAMLANREQVQHLPQSYTDLLTPLYKNKIILTYPHDDDAVLYLYKKIVDKYGWNYIDQLIKQNPQWIRGTAAPEAQVRKGNKLATIASAGVFDTSIDGGAQVVLPSEDPFLTWAQTAAIFKATRHKAAAKLYVTWMLSKKMQNQWVEWSVRDDLPTKAGYNSYKTYPNTSPEEFIKFMLDRNSLNAFSKQIEAKIGPVQGGSPLTDPAILDLL
ncbi:ABC transporter substrate-binding protein [Chryseobacterium sp.]|uniref:ABC transporter substrate-binding protein n=1 Tax=Chryseobacterium sp. TaxID=1871047 RepID=UPI0025C181D7|nr:ABC transporter substrate-binding protein [Chryseobacterium sp.]MBV8327444.1 ABC transporter substrate-binding protein [Chryseobacterium sp.]